MKEPEENHPLMYGKKYHCWREGKYLGIAVYTEDENIGDCFLEEIGEKKFQVFMPDKWSLT